MKNRRRLSGAVALLCVIMVAAFLVPRTARAEGRVLRVAAAASLSFAFAELVPAFERDTGIDVVTSLGSTGMLARQIEHGAPFDLFFAADESYVKGLGDKGRVEPGTTRVYAEGRLALVVNTKSGAEAQSLKSLASLADVRIKRVAIANPDHAPYGRAAREALQEAGVWESVRPRLVYGENVRQALRFVQTGNAPAGIVALSVADAPGVTPFAVDPALHAPINQAAMVVRGTSMGAEARAFIEYVTGPDGRAIMKSHGFFPPNAGGPEAAPHN